MHLFRYLTVLLLSTVVALAGHPTPAMAEMLVKRAQVYAQTHGIAQLIEQTNQGDGLFHVGQGGELYLFIYDLKGNCVAIGYNTGTFVGVNRLDVRGPDGKFFLRDMITLVKTKGTGWIDYSYPNPAEANRVQPKTAYLTLFDGYLIGAGIYKY